MRCSRSQSGIALVAEMDPSELSGDETELLLLFKLISDPKLGVDPNFFALDSGVDDGDGVEATIPRR